MKDEELLFKEYKEFHTGGWNTVKVLVAVAASSLTVGFFAIKGFIQCFLK